MWVNSWYPEIGGLFAQIIRLTGKPKEYRTNFLSGGNFLFKEMTVKEQIGILIMVWKILNFWPLFKFSFGFTHSFSVLWSNHVIKIK